MGIESIAIIVALILSIVIHEVAHGYMANFLGDPTARLAGRLNLNPFVHLDPLGSIIIPGLLFISGTGFLFGWAKPVPYNPYNLKNQKWGESLVAAAGPGVNILIAVIFSMFVRLSDVFNLSASVVEFFGYIIFINILLAFFNMIPIPPLDGSKMLIALLPYNLAIKYREFTMMIERLGIFVLFIFIFIMIQFLWPFLEWAVTSFASLLMGM